MLTHVDKNNMPTMVDVSEKAVTQRTARAQSLVQLPIELKPYLQGEDLLLKKGPVFQTAVIAGTMAAKKTADTIPFCHQIPLESCKIEISADEAMLVTVSCTVKTTSKTGVEMEALTGASAAALTIYDMCKAVSHNIVIRETRLLSKTGGKRTVLDKPLYGLVLTGGKSTRMQKDKALISYNGRPHAEYIYGVLKNYCSGVYLSARPQQWKDTPLENLPTLTDSKTTDGPMNGLLTAFEAHPEANWVVVACDLIHFNEKTVEGLLANYNPETVATAYKNKEKGFPEALCALYTPKAKTLFTAALANGTTCPVKTLKSASVSLIEQSEGIDLANINTVEEFAEVMNEKH